MINKNTLSVFSEAFLKLKYNFNQIYQNSNFYEKKISKTFNNDFEYKPSPHLLSSIIKYQKKNIELKILKLILSGKIKLILKIIRN